MKLRKKLMVWGAFLIMGLVLTACAEESYFDSIVAVEDTSSDGMGLGDGSGDSSVGNVHVVKNSAGDAIKGLFGGSDNKDNNTVSESAGGSGNGSVAVGGSEGSVGSFDSYSAPGSDSSYVLPGSGNSSGRGSSDNGVYIDGDIDAVYPEGYGEYEDGVFREDGEDGLIEDIEASSEAIPEMNNKDKKEDSDSTKTNEPAESEEKDKDKTVASVPDKEETGSSSEKKEETTVSVKEETKETASTEPVKEKEPEKENTPETKEVVKETPAPKPAPEPEPEPETPAEPPINVEEESKDINIRIFVMNECGARFGMICIIDPYTQEAIRVGALGHEEMFILDMKWPTKEKHFRIGCYDESGNLVKEDSIDFKHISKGCIITFTGNGSLDQIQIEVE